VDKWVIGTYPLLNNKPALIRAFHRTTKHDGDGDDFVEAEEFHALLLNLFWFGHLHCIFEDIDTQHDDRLDLREFQDGLDKLGVRMSRPEAEREFRSMDADGGGAVLFAEFCAYVRHRVSPDHNPAFDADLVSSDRCQDTVRRKHGDKATHSHFLSKKTMGDFDAAERRIKAIISDSSRLKKLWERVDYNCNGSASIGEVERTVTHLFPLLNHRPALLRAFYAACRSRGNSDDNVHKVDFKRFLGGLLYFNKAFWLLDQVDENKDRRLDLQEFKWSLTLCGAKTSEAKATAEFQKLVGSAGGAGLLTFDEFCAYLAGRCCPECMDEWKDDS